MSQQPPALSIVATMYNSETYVAEFVKRISDCAAQIVDSFEIILVNDGSPDDSMSVAKGLLATTPQLRLVELSRNYGHHRAMMIGIEQAIGQKVFLTDIDLEEEPENLPRFWQAMEEDPDTDVVYGCLEKKTEQPLLKHLSSDLFYQVFNRLSSVKISSRELVSRIMKRRFVDALLQYQEESIFLPAVWTDAGFNIKGVTTQKYFDGNSTYSTRKKLKMAVDAVTSFSELPLVFVFYVGMGISALAGVAIVYFVIMKLLFGAPLLGWTSLIASIFLMGGLIMSSVGVIGIYISKIFLEVKNRPRAIIRATYPTPAEPGVSE